MGWSMLPGSGSVSRNGWTNRAFSAALGVGIRVHGPGKWPLLFAACQSTESKEEGQTNFQLNHCLLLQCIPWGQQVEVFRREGSRFCQRQRQSTLQASGCSSGATAESVPLGSSLSQGLGLLLTPNPLLFRRNLGHSTPLPETLGWGWTTFGAGCMRQDLVPLTFIAPSFPAFKEASFPAGSLSGIRLAPKGRGHYHDRQPLRACTFHKGDWMREFSKWQVPNLASWGRPSREDSLFPSDVPQVLVRLCLSYLCPFGEQVCFYSHSPEVTAALMLFWKWNWSLCAGRVWGSQEREGIKVWGGEGSLLTGSELPPAQGEPGGWAALFTVRSNWEGGCRPLPPNHPLEETLRDSSLQRKYQTLPNAPSTYKVDLLCIFLMYIFFTPHFLSP